VFFAQFARRKIPSAGQLRHRHASVPSATTHVNRSSLQIQQSPLHCHLQMPSGTRLHHFLRISRAEFALLHEYSFTAPRSFWNTQRTSSFAQMRRCGIPSLQSPRLYGKTPRNHKPLVLNPYANSFRNNNPPWHRAASSSGEYTPAASHSKYSNPRRPLSP